MERPAAAVEECQVVLSCPDEQSFVEQCRDGAQSPIRTLLFGNLALRGSRHLLALALQVLPAGAAAAEEHGGQEAWGDLWSLKPSATQLAIVGLGAAAVAGGFWATAAASSVKVSGMGLALLPAFQAEMPEAGDRPVADLQSETADREE